MPTYFHGTVSIYQESILKEGLRLTPGHPKIDHEAGKRFVWLSPDIAVAADYAEIRAKSCSTPVGECFEVIRRIRYPDEKTVAPYLRPLRESMVRYRLAKLEPFVDPSARPIVFAINLPESWKVTESPTIPGEWLSRRRIPASMLTLLEEIGYTSERQIKAIDATLDALALASCVGNQLWSLLNGGMG